MSIGIIFLLILLVLLATSIPTWPYSKNWGYYPSGGIGILLVIMVVLMFTGRV